MAYAYPFDPTGQSTGNRIVQEQHVITAANFRDYHYVVPKFAPFFATNMIIRLQYPDSTVRLLTHGVDYYLSHQFLDASRACASPIYGSISFLDTDSAGILSITYQTVGGMWTLSTEEITRILAEELRNPRITTWEQVTDRPVRFPVIDHEWDLIDMVGMKETSEAIDRVREAILESSDSSTSSHANNRENPHQVTKAQVGLGSVENFTIASTAQAEAGIVNNQYMTPQRTKEAITAQAGTLLTAHASKTNNPHAVTKTQVGLGNVPNYPVATVQEAIDGVLANAFMTPVGTAAAIGVVNSGLTAHVTNDQNPHNTTKAQVGLFNVENFPVATAQEAREGVRPDRYMTPQRTKQLVVEYIAVELDGHAVNMDNPHQVNKMQVGLGNVANYAIATLSDMTAGVSTDKYVTPSLVHAKISAVVTQVIDAHVTDNQNPHNTTKAQVGLGNVANYAIATTLEMTAGTATDKYVTPSLVHAKVNTAVTQAVAAHVANDQNPHNVTAAQVGAYSVTEINTKLVDYLGINDVAFDTALWQGMTQAEFRDWLKNNFAGFSADYVGGMTAQQIIAAAAGGLSGGYLQSRTASDNKVAAGNSHLWVPIALLDRAVVALGGAEALDPVITIDSMLLVTGGDQRVSGVKRESSSFLIRATCRNSVTLNVDYFYEKHTIANISFGYVWNATTEDMTVYAKIANGADDLSIIDLCNREHSSLDLGGKLSAEPAGIVYATPTPSIHSRASTLEASKVTSDARITALEAYKTSNQTAVADLQAAKLVSDNKILALETSVQDIITLLNSITVV